MDEQIKRTERGWPAHFVCASRCLFRRNTLLEKGELRVVVSTVGAFKPDIDKKGYHEIGLGRHYETMAFMAKKEFAPPPAKKEKFYWHADVQKQIPLSGKIAIPSIEFEDDMSADEMHERAVAELVEKMEKSLPIQTDNINE